MVEGYDAALGYLVEAEAVVVMQCSKSVSGHQRRASNAF
jgi:hypothetical protein